MKLAHDALVLLLNARQNGDRSSGLSQAQGYTAANSALCRPNRATSDGVDRKLEHKGVRIGTQARFRKNKKLYNWATTF
jgi:hypothetical protein